MARKTAADLKPRPSPPKRSYAAVGIDTSLTAVSVVVMGYDAITRKHKGPFHGEVRWTPEIDYFTRLHQALKVDALVNSLVAQTWVRDADRTFIAVEEPFHYGAIKRNIGGWIKQQAEVGGAVKAGLVSAGYQNIYEIGNSQWHATLRREGVEFVKIPRGSSSGERAALTLAKKFAVKTWAIQAFGLPDLPDLVASKSGAKIPRPETGFGANAKAVQPSDIYDAAACCAWMLDTIESDDSSESV